MNTRYRPPCYRECSRPRIIHRSIPLSLSLFLCLSAKFPMVRSSVIGINLYSLIQKYQLQTPPWLFESGPEPSPNHPSVTPIHNTWREGEAQTLRLLLLSSKQRRRDFFPSFSRDFQDFVLWRLNGLRVLYLRRRGPTGDPFKAVRSLGSTRGWTSSVIPGLSRA